jgi:pyrimidine operon attenuation protein/uracil phosphoribosyltransferase
LAERLSELLHPHGPVPVGSVDISLYRDDAGTALPNPRIGPTRLPMAIEGLHVVLVDDVLYTGRTVRAAVDALLDYGRPAKVELAVLLDRDGRELPIQADYSVRKVGVSAAERVDVLVDGASFSAIAVPQGSPTSPPPPADLKEIDS